jgi:hypothetical protein
LVDYRRADYSQAIEWCIKSRTIWHDGGPGYEATAHLISALAHQALEQEVPARTELDEGRRCLVAQAYSDAAHVWPLIVGLYAETLLHEATVRIEGASPHDLGHTLRQQALGELYAEGRFVDKDPAKALPLFVEASEAGLIKHQFQVGWMYSRGLGTPTNMVEAFRWFSEVASRTNSNHTVNFEEWSGPGKRDIRDCVGAWIQLGLMCAHGQGVPQDTEQARAWFQKVAEDWSYGGEDSVFLNALAWSLATARDPNARFGPAAVFLADEAVRTCGPLEKPLYLDTLAAACAETGDFEKAVATEKESMTLLTDKMAIDDFTSRLNLYESNTPFRER